MEMKFFGGLSAPEISRVLGISRATVDRDWATARVWLHRQMSRTAYAMTIQGVGARQRITPPGHATGPRAARPVSR